jgi:RimJ/RimL family protein N-acetyltransferase
MRRSARRAGWSCPITGATATLGAVLERARADDRWGDIHAFPGVTNGASNALCRKFAFEQLEGGDADYAGRRFPVNHWVWRAGTPDPGIDAPNQR